MGVYEWLRKAIADPNLTPLRKLLQRRDLDPKLRSSVQAFVDHDEAYRPFMKWTRDNTCTLSAVRECEAIDSYYHLYSADGTKTCWATVQQESIDLSGDGKVGLYKVKVIHVAAASADGSWSEIADASAPIAQRLAQFIAALWLDNPARHSAEITFDLGEKNP